MQQNRIFGIFILLGLLLSSCIKPYYPDINASDMGRYIVAGQLDNQSHNQTVCISRTSPLSDQTPVPEAGCIVTITDDKGNSFSLTETTPGTYNVFIDKQFLNPGTSYKVDVITTDGTRLTSDFDRMPQCPEVDSVYYRRKDLAGSEPGTYTRGIQFFIDQKGTAADSRFYKWDLTETWEYHTQYPREWYYDGRRVIHIFPPDYSLSVCWNTQPVKELFLLSTSNLEENRYKMLPLQFVSNQTARLMYGYSLLVQQSAISEEAYNYWEQMRNNSTGQGGLYETQPLTVKGNIHNTTRPEEQVLGFFNAASVSSKRIFIRKIDNFQMEYSFPCWGKELIAGFRDVHHYPAYLLGDENGYQMIWINDECVDCKASGGTTVKPDYWPW